MMSRDDAVAFGKASAAMALDQADAYGSLKNSLDSHRDNVRDTLNDERSAEHEEAAWSAFDAAVSASTLP